MSNRAEWWLHFVLGAVIAAAELWTTGSAVLAIAWSSLVGFVREVEQERAQIRYVEFGFRSPWNVARWGSHRVNEWMAWAIGGAAVVSFYALFLR